uniref:Ig-like domain-containing protein n=1 Tax=Anolis carolinensis TaxID=28377 RepID=H9G6W6_ANOCA
MLCQLCDKYICHTLLLSMQFPSFFLKKTLTETGGGVKKPGETLWLTCTVSGFSLTSYAVDWMRQPPGKRLEWVAAIWSNGSPFYNSALQNRMTITKDNSKNQVFLYWTIKPEDAAVYYCAKEKGTVKRALSKAA